MGKQRNARLAAWLTRLYDFFLLAFPRDFRDRDGDEVRRAFGEGCREMAARRGLHGLAGYALRGFWDALREGVDERRDHRSRLRGAPDTRRAMLIAPLAQDLRIAARSFARRPGFTGVALLTLSLGIGAATALFSVVNGVLLKPFPYPNAHQLVVLWNTNPSRGLDQYRMAGPEFFEIERSAVSFQGVAVIAGATTSLTDDDLPPVRVDGAAVSANLFQVLGVRPDLGRTFRAEENQGEHRVAILSHALWAGRFAGDSAVVGSTVTMDGNQFQVVGVMPSVSLPLGGGSLRLAGPEDAAYWVPLDYTQQWVLDIGAHVLSIVARLGPDGTADQAATEMTALARAVEEAGGTPGEGILVRSFRDQVVGDISHNLMVLLGAVFLLLLMACGNLANLFLARATDRESELAVRMALGAGKFRVVRQFLAEILLLGVLGGLLGMALAHWGTGALLAVMPSGLPRQDQIGVDAIVLLFAFSAVLVATLLAGLVPSLRSAGRDPSRGLREGGRGGTASKENLRANRSIVVFQFGLAAVLLVAAGLLAKSLITLRNVDPGFRSDGILTAQLVLPDSRYREPDRSLFFFDELRRGLEALPEVSSAVLSMDHPLENTWWNGVSLLDQPPPREGESPTGIFRPVSDGYFRVYEIPLVEGRVFEARDRMGEAGVMIVNQAFRERHFPNGNALGQRVRFTVGQFIWGSGAPTDFEVVGVVGDVRFNGLREPSEPAFYIPVGQFPYSAMKVHLRTEGDPADLIDLLKTEIWSLDPDLSVSDIRTMDQILASATAQDRFNTILLGVFALAALVLAGSGIFGVLSYMVAQRSREMGIRLALGAEPRKVLGLVVRTGALTAALGVAGGLGASLALTPLLASLLFGVQPNDVSVFGWVTGILAGVALVATIAPALRAARTDPIETLRGD